MENNPLRNQRKNYNKIGNLVHCISFTVLPKPIGKDPPTIVEICPINLFGHPSIFWVHIREKL